MIALLEVSLVGVDSAISGYLILCNSLWRMSKVQIIFVMFKV